MKGYLVDINIPSEFPRNQPDIRVADFIRKAGQENLFLSVMTVGEICKGIDLLPVSKKRAGLQAWLDIELRSWFAGRILPVTETIAGTLGPYGRRRKKARCHAGGGGRYCSHAQREGFRRAWRHGPEPLGRCMRQQRSCRRGSCRASPMQESKPR